MKKLSILSLFLISTFLVNAQAKKYCVENYKGKYEIILSDYGSHSASFNLYDGSNNLKNLLKVSGC